MMDSGTGGSARPVLEHRRIDYIGYVERTQLEVILDICFQQVLDYAAGKPANVIIS